MSVYTAVTSEHLEAFLTHYELGNLVDLKGISSGIENTNYFVTTSVGEFVLTLFEQHRYEELPYFLELMAYLADNGVPSAHPVADKQGHYLRYLNRKPAALVERLRGRDVSIPTLAQCDTLGNTVGYFHSISPHFPHYRANERGAHWRITTANKVMPFLSTEDAVLLQTELQFQASQKPLDLPIGVIHADLFRDNVLFEDDNLYGIIDFYYACNDVLLYDVAVTLNDWCSTHDGTLDENRVATILMGYLQRRQLSALEYRALPILLRAAALRFWLSRLKDLHFPRSGEITHTKDPNEFRNILKAHVAQNRNYQNLYTDKSTCS